MSAPVFVPEVVTCPDCVANAVEHLDEDWAVPCERIGPPTCRGENPAAWVVYFVRCCPDKPVCSLWCDPCTRRFLAGFGAYCPRCKVRTSNPRTSLTRIEPLNRRTT